MNKNEIKELSILFNNLEYEQPKKKGYAPLNRGNGKLISIWNDMEKREKANEANKYEYEQKRA